MPSEKRAPPLIATTAAILGAAWTLIGTVSTGLDLLDFAKWRLSLFLAALIFIFAMVFQYVQQHRTIEKLKSELRAGRGDKRARLRRLYDEGLNLGNTWEDGHPAGQEAWRGEVQGLYANIEALLRSEYSPALAKAFAEITSSDLHTKTGRDILLTKRLEFVWRLVRGGASLHPEKFIIYATPPVTSNIPITLEGDIYNGEDEPLALRTFEIEFCTVNHEEDETPLFKTPVLMRGGAVLNVAPKQFRRVYFFGDVKGPDIQKLPQAGIAFLVAKDHANNDHRFRAGEVPRR